MADTRPLQSAQCVGEMIHAGVDFSKLRAMIENIAADPKALITFCAEHAPGSATLGLIEASNVGLNLAERCGKAIDVMFASDRYKDITGIKIGLNHTPAMVLTDTFKQLLLSSPVLTPAGVAAVRDNVKAKGGCTISVLYQAHHLKDGSVAGSHVEVIVTPDNEEDGPPLALSLVLTLPNDEKWKNARAIIQQLTGCDNLDPPAPDSDLSKAFCGPPGTRALGPDNVMLVLPRDKWAATLAEYLARNKLEAVNTEPDCEIGVHTHPTEAITTHEGDVYAMSVFKQLETLSRTSIEGGNLLSYGSHLGMHSCVTNAVRLLACALPDKFKAPENRFVSAKKLIDVLVDNGDGFYLAKKRNARINEYDDADVFEQVTPKLVRDHITKIWADENLNRQLTSDLPSWANMYDNFTTSHPDPDARAFYVQIAWAVTHHLENMADDLETVEDMMASVSIRDFAPPLSSPRQEAPTKSFKIGRLASLPDSEKHEIADLIDNALREMEKTPLLTDDEILKAGDEIFRALDEAVTQQVTETYGEEAARALVAQAQRSSRQSGGEAFVSRLETLVEIVEPGSTENLDDVVEPSLTGSPEQRAAAYRAMGIALRLFPSQAKKIKALCWLLLSDPLRIGLGLMVFWQSIRYAHSNDGGRTADLGPEIAGVLLFTMCMPALDTIVDHLAMTSGGQLQRVRPLQYPYRFAQQLPQAAVGGHIIGYTMGLIPGVSSDANVPTRLSSELARLVVGLWSSAALSYYTDRYLFGQEFDHLEMEGSARNTALKALNRMRQDLGTVEHWMRVRIPLATALGLHRETTQFWFRVYDSSDSAIVRNLVGGSQFATFYVSVTLFMMLGGLRYDIEDPRVLRLAPWLFKNKIPITDPEHEEA
ncbi:hypothetical protein AM571_PA00275 (plasmid) [Rhizobium etli 8C-3]|uniref:Uncharacterized protein n=2 Tax=Rhizobium etli TaxID=29449 RepID=A0A1L5PAG6_RHIET|nr:hypothetical protein AM571_PA00275 [Rhizobium etli 8C-3]